MRKMFRERKTFSWFFFITGSGPERKSGAERVRVKIRRAHEVLMTSWQKFFVWWFSEREAFMQDDMRISLTRMFTSRIGFSKKFTQIDSTAIIRNDRRWKWRERLIFSRVELSTLTFCSFTPPIQLAANVLGLSESCPPRKAPTGGQKGKSKQKFSTWPQRRFTSTLDVWVRPEWRQRKMRK